MRSYCTESAAGIFSRMACASGVWAACCCVQPASGIAATIINTTRARRDITGPDLPRHRWDIVLRRPHQRHDPPNHAPTQKEIEQEDGEQIALASSQSNDRRQEVHHKSKAKEWEEEYRRKHGCLPLIA